MFASLFAGLGSKLIVPAIIALIAAGSAWMARGHWDAGDIESLKAQYARQVQAQMEQAARDSAAALAKQQQQIAEARARIDELTADRKITTDLLATVNEKIHHAQPSSPGQCGPYRAVVDGMRGH